MIEPKQNEMKHVCEWSETIWAHSIQMHGALVLNMVQGV